MASSHEEEDCLSHSHSPSFPHPQSQLSLPQDCLSIIPLVFTIYLTWRCARFLLQLCLSSLQRLLTVSVQATGTLNDDSDTNDDTYDSLVKWLGKNFRSSLHKEKIHPKTISCKEHEDDGDQDEEGDLRPQPEFNYVYKNTPTVGYGVNNIWYKGCWIQVKREFLEGVDRPDGSQEMLELTTFKWNKALLDEILEAAKPSPGRRNDDEKKIVIHKAIVTINGDCFWQQLGKPKKKRPLSTLILDDRVVTKVIQDIQEFQGMEEWYLSKGIPYRRGYLLYGPPGCGKSSIVKAIASELDYDICVLSLSQKLTDNNLTELFNLAPAKSIILLEDIDAVFKSRENDYASARETNLAFEGCSQSALTFMGLLNALDGVASSDYGQIVILTTNYPEKLDPALIRPGRVDMKVILDYPSDIQIGGMFKKFYPEKGEDTEMIERFVKAIRVLDLKLSMAMLQSLMVVYRNDPEAAIEKADAHFKDQFANERIARDKSTGLYC